MKKFISITLFLIAFSAEATAQNLAGNWEGHITIQGNQLIIKTDFRQHDDGYSGSIDIPQQGATDLQLQNVETTKNDSVYFEFMAGPGLAQFKGAFETDSTIYGSFYQNGLQFPFELKRSKPETESKTVQAPPSYNQEELIIKNDSIDIGGTLTWPENQATNKLVIMISGSGAQNRDEEILGFKPFFQIADYLTLNGIATFRYDDRGVAQSTGSFADATLDILAADVEAVITNLSGRGDHEFEEIILLGHSQGGLVAGRVAAKYNAVDKLILMASPAISLQEVLRFQVRQAFSQAGVDSLLIEEEIKAREHLIDAILKNEKFEEAKERYREKFEAVQRSAGLDSAKASSISRQQSEQLVAAFSSPQMKSFIKYSPVADLQSIKIPVLVLLGGKDTQITIDMHKKPISDALDDAGVQYAVAEFENANHLFQKAETGAASEYGSLDKEFVGGFLETIEQWIKK
jgi:pimeloyl-ACP methyl ester carboxylesterase